MRPLHPLALAGLLTVAISCGQPTGQPSDLQPDPPRSQLANPAGGGTQVTWKNPKDADFALVLVVRYAGAPDGHPGAESPMVGAAFGSGTVVYAGTGETYFDAVLPMMCGVFTYELWSRDARGHWSDAAVWALTTKGGLAPPSMGPSMLAAMAQGSQALLSWALPPESAGASLTRVVRRLGSSPTRADDGTTVFEGPGTSTTEPLSALPTGQTVFYAAFGCNACGVCANVSGSGSSTSMLVPSTDGGTLDAGPEPDGGSAWRPSNLSAGLSTDGQQVQLRWTNPSSAGGFTQVKLLRQLNATAVGSNDSTATTLFTGLATSFAERLDTLVPSVAGSTPRTYYYSVFGCQDLSCETGGATAPFTFTVTQALHGGGYVLWWRHATASTCGDQTNLGACQRPGAGGCPSNLVANGTDWCCPGGASLDWWKSCDTNCATAFARQLTPPQSDLETSTIHDQFASKGIHVGKVMASELCRGIGTATGFNFGPAVEPTKELTYFVYDEANRCTNTYALLNTPPSSPGFNTALVSHAGFACPIIDSNAWGEAAIFKPQPGGQPLFITKVLYSQWVTLP